MLKTAPKVQLNPGIFTTMDDHPTADRTVRNCRENNTNQVTAKAGRAAAGKIGIVPYLLLFWNQIKYEIWLQFNRVSYQYRFWKRFLFLGSPKHLPDIPGRTRGFLLPLFHMRTDSTTRNSFIRSFLLQVHTSRSDFKKGTAFDSYCFSHKSGEQLFARILTYTQTSKDYNKNNNTINTKAQTRQ